MSRSMMRHMPLPGSMSGCMVQWADEMYDTGITMSAGGRRMVVGGRCGIEAWK